MNASYEPVIGLEIHVRLATATKLFCACPSGDSREPNTATCPVCLGHPGALPVINQQAITLGTRAALALGCQLNERSVFARKSYFYPDLPKGYQISQYAEPLAGPGIFSGIHLNRIHLEDDAGKLTHLTASGRIGAGDSLVDFNRSGSPLIEIVTEPDFHDPSAVAEWLRWLRLTLIAAGISDGEMEHGSLRCDVNISLRAVGETGYGVKTELKNLNSFRFIERGLVAEINRQTTMLATGQAVGQATIHYNPQTDQTSVLREKAGAADYRYFAEPDLAPIMLDDELCRREQAALGELPLARYARYRQLEIAEAIARLLVERPDLGDFFDRAHRRANGPQLAQWLTGEVLGRAGEIELAQLPIQPPELDALVAEVGAGTITLAAGRQILDQLLVHGGTVQAIIDQEGFTLAGDDRLDQWITAAIAADPVSAVEAQAGNSKAFGPLIGFVMRQAAGQADGRQVARLLKERLNGANAA